MNRSPERTSARPFLERFFPSLARPARVTTRHSADADHVISLCRTLLSERGELSGARLATDVVAAYRSLDPAGLDAFFNALAREFSPDPIAVTAAAAAYTADTSAVNLIRLQKAIEPPRQELFRRFNMAPGGIGALVDMRRLLLQTLSTRPERVGVDADLSHLFRSWFNRGFLVLQRIDWGTSALVLERLIRYEAVHEIHGWRDLRRRLEADRRCYAFFHPALPDEPLIFIEIALTRGVPDRVQPLLDPDAPVVDPAGANCAVFYSITTCQEGLRGISFGNFLIKQVAEDLGRGFAGLRTFATLSPVPGFVDWLRQRDRKLPRPLSSELAAALEELGRGDPAAMTLALRPHLRQEISRLGAYYLLKGKRARAPLDSVARFHLANGARLDRLNWMGDMSSAGLRRSLGLTVNYVYRLSDLERNHESYAKNFDVVASRAFHRLASEASADDDHRTPAA